MSSLGSCEPKMMPTIILNHYFHQIWVLNFIIQSKIMKENVDLEFWFESELKVTFSVINLVHVLKLYLNCA